MTLKDYAMISLSEAHQGVPRDLTIVVFSLPRGRFEIN